MKSEMKHQDAPALHRHPRRNVQGERSGPIGHEIALDGPYGNRIAFEELTLKNGRKVNRLGDLPVCPFCGCDLEQKIADGKYTRVNVEAISPDRIARAKVTLG